jgi:hypothetical protein
MVYAQINTDLNPLPMPWDKCESMFKYLNSMAWGYQFMAERKMFATAGPEFRCVLVQWEDNPLSNLARDRKRKVLLETSDPEHMEMVLLVLIKEVEAQAKANNVRSIL